MEVRALGRSGVDVSRVILGCGNFGGVGSSPAYFGAGETEGEAHALLDAAWAAGITTFDTADAYGGGRSESYIGSWLRTKGPDVRDRLVLTTKTFNPMQEGADRGLAPARVRRQLESSLTRLGVDAVDLYLAHEPDPDTPLEETLGVLAELQREGKLRAFGGSNVDRGWLEEALGHAAAGGPRVEWAQNSYSLLERGDERGVLDVCAREALGYTPFGPLAGGWLTGKYRRGEPPPEGSRMTIRPEPYEHLRDDRTFDALEAFEAQAAERGTTPAALALAWVLSHPHVTAVVIGPRRAEHLHPALDALELRLSPVERGTLTELFA
jgi:aryl-alcohol dehydrogenase-like predicted oxidoreductase